MGVLRLAYLETIQLPQNPPPDLVIESDYTSSSLDKFDIYASIGVPELWRYSKGSLQIYLRQGDNYQLSSSSLAFPNIPVAEIPSLIEDSKQQGQRSVVRAFRKMLQALD